MAVKIFGKKAPFPKTLKPMLATLVHQPFDEPGWIYEIKWDGYRAVARLNKGFHSLQNTLMIKVSCSEK